MYAVSDPVIIAVFLPVSTIVVLAATRWLDAKKSRDDAIAAALLQKTREEREDLVAQRVHEAAEKLEKNNEEVAKSAGILSDKVDVVHGLVNNDKTEGLKTQLALHRLNLRLMNKDKDSESTPEEIAVTKSDIERLEKTIAARLEEDKIAQAKMGLIAKKQEST